MSKSDDALLQQARDRFKLGDEAGANQRKRDKLALRMYNLDQWEESAQQARAAVQPTGTMPGAPARPCLVLDMLREPVHQIVNQERESDLSVELVASDDFGGLGEPIDPSEIELREGLIRRLQRESEASSARGWAFLEAVITGHGYYAINTRYGPGKNFDQEVYYRRIYNQLSVVLDPAHVEPDGSDAEWGFIYTVLSKDAYQAQYPRAKDGKKNSYADCSDNEWRRAGELAPEWFTSEGQKPYVRVAEYWYTEHTSRTLCELPAPVTLTRPDGQSYTTTTVWKDEYTLPEGQKPTAERTVVEKKVKWCKLDGCQILEETDWPSPHIPIIKIVGNEIPPYDNERHVDGVVNKSAIEGQRGRNYMGSGVVEQFGVQPISPLMVAEGSIEGYELFYGQANTRAFPWLPYKQVDLEGRPAPPPFRPDKSVQVGQYAQGMQMFVESIQSSTNVSSPQMGRPSRYSETWRGTKALIDQGERGTSNYMDNYQRSLRYDGRVANSLLRPIYGRPGRLARIVQGEGENETILIGAPFTMQDNGQGSQRPVPAPPGATSQQEGVREYRLTEAGDSADVTVKVKKGSGTRRQEESAMFSEMLTQNPQLMTWFGHLFFRSLDTPGSKEAAEIAELMLDPKIQAMNEQKKGGAPAMSPVVIQQMQQMEQQLQQVTQAAQGMQQELQSQFSVKQMQMQAEKEIAQIKAQAELNLAQLKAEVEIRLAEIKAGTELQTSRETQEAEERRQRLSGQQDIVQAAVEAELQPVPVAESQV